MPCSHRQCSSAIPCRAHIVSAVQRSHAVLTSSVQFSVPMPCSHRQCSCALGAVPILTASPGVALLLAIRSVVWRLVKWGNPEVCVFLCLDDNATRPLVGVWQLSLTCRGVTGLTCRGVTSRSFSLFLFSLKKQPRLVISCFLSWLDCCNCHLMGTFQNVLNRLYVFQCYK